MKHANDKDNLAMSFSRALLRDLTPIMFLGEIVVLKNRIVDQVEIKCVSLPRER